MDTVTGSRYLVEGERGRILVDCGLFQGPKKLRERNWKELPFAVDRLDAIVLTHAHIDHAGFLPRLSAAGYDGPIYCTHGTRDLLQLLLPDAGHLQEEEAEFANRVGYSCHHPALPLYTEEQARACLSQLEPLDFHAGFEPAGGMVATYTRAGHIIGSACVALHVEDTSITFTGDVGRPNDPLMKPPEPLAATDYLVVESTYGDRKHPPDDTANVLARLVRETVEKRGVLLVPSFAVGRTQHVLYLLARLRSEQRIPDCPIYLDSPMAVDATELFRAHADEHLFVDDSMFRIANYARTPEDSKAIDRATGPMIVISASGMCTGGRILHHLARFLPDERTTVLFVGYQAAGTRGRSLVDGASEVKMLGQYVQVRARVVALDGLSAHADYAELLDWLAVSKIEPREVFVTHGEPGSSDAFRRRLHETFGWRARVPDSGEIVPLAQAATAKAPRRRSTSRAAS